MSRSLASALLVLCAPIAVLGQTPPATPSQPAASDEVPTRGRPERSGTAVSDKPSALEDAIGYALKKNFDLRLQALTVDNAKDTVAIQAAAFDPTLTATARRAVNQQASTTSRLDGTATEGPRSDNTTMSVGAT